MISPEDKQWIDNASIRQLLIRCRFATAGDAIFQGETGDYYINVMCAKRDADPAAWTHASKDIGW